MAFLEMIKEDFNKRYAGGKAATATANSLTQDFGPRLRDQMQYCTDHPEEVSKLSKVKAQVDQVKSIMMENIDKIGQNLAAISRNAGWRQKQENKCKMEALNLHHLSAVIKEAPKTPSPLPKRRRIIEDAVVVPSPPRRSRRLAQLPEVKYAEIAPHTAVRMTRSPRKPADLIYMARSGTISMKARLEATKKAEELESQLDPDIPSFVKAMLHSHVVRGFWLGLPSHSCDTYMLKQDAIITLLDEKDEEFDTNYLAYKKGLSGGWAGFALCHGIQDGDAAVFQLIKPTTFKVYIIRAASDDGSERDE